MTSDMLSALKSRVKYNTREQYVILLEPKPIANVMEPEEYMAIPQRHVMTLLLLQSSNKHFEVGYRCITLSFSFRC
jgi:hypothetical protein